MRAHATSMTAAHHSGPLPARLQHGQCSSCAAWLEPLLGRLAWGSGQLHQALTSHEAMPWCLPPCKRMAGLRKERGSVLRWHMHVCNSLHSAPVMPAAVRMVSRVSRPGAHAGLLPFYMVGTIGTTSSCAVDPIGEMGAIAQKYKIW